MSADAAGARHEDEANIYAPDSSDEDADAGAGAAAQQDNQNDAVVDEQVHAML